MSEETKLREVKNIHEAIWAIMEQVGYVQKVKSSQLSYSYAGEAGLIAALRPWMVAYGVYVSVIDISNIVHEWYTTANGKQMVNTTLRAVIRFMHAPSNTYFDAVAVGEGSDTGDKSQNKAMTGAFKYALRNTFCIETGDDPDKDPSEQYERGSNGHKETKTEKTETKANGKAHTQRELVAYAASKGLDTTELGKALGASGFTGVDLARWDDMKIAVDSYKG